MARTQKPKSKAAQIHADWIGMVQPDGLVVSTAVLEEMDLYVQQDSSVQQNLRACTEDDRLPNLSVLLHDILGWKPARLVPPDSVTPPVVLDLPDVGVTLSPTALGTSPQGDVRIVVHWLDADPDATPSGDHWPASHTERFERLLHRTGYATGLLVTPTAIRLIYAPVGEAPGRLTFPVDALRKADGRLLVDALLMLLGSRRLFAVPEGQRLGDVLKASRLRQEQVTETLAAQVEDALRVLLSGFDAANARTQGALLQDVSGPMLYDGLSTVLLRLIFILYAEDYGLLPLSDSLYENGYSVVGLGETLSEDAVAHGEAQTRRFSAWPRLLSLFRLIWGGGSSRTLHLPPRQGDLFHPDRFPFLEGRPLASNHRTDPVHVPPVDDACLRQTLDRLLFLDGQRISYRNLEVEQIGSVYEALMGFSVERAASEAVALKGGVMVELGALAEAEHPTLYLQSITGERNARLRAQLPAVQAFTPTGDPDKDRATLRAALSPLLDPSRSPVRPGHHYLQPGSARRGSGSHYTPRSLTEPIVRHTLAPLLGASPSSAHILGLRICDPAMGSGAFLAETCRQLADALVLAWAREGATPHSHHNPTLVARRKVSEQCLYGVDKNPRAVQLARLSLWLITSAADLPFTFLDHALREGDALVGVNLPQMVAFDFFPDAQQHTREPFFRAAMDAAARTRAQITARQREMTYARDEYLQQTNWLTHADDEVWDERRVGDLLVACAWAGGTKTQQRKRIQAMGDLTRRWYPAEVHTPMPPEAEALLAALPMRPFHWWLEFPEVFRRANPGFDAIVGNPPFGGQQTIRDANGGATYIKLLQQFWPHAHGNADLCSYFFLQMTTILRANGCFGFVASNTIKQGDTLDTGLRHILANTRTHLFRATTDMKWPVSGAAVVVDIVCGKNGPWRGPRFLNDVEVTTINSTLTSTTESQAPIALSENKSKCFLGSKIYGQGFLLTPDEAHRLIAENPARAQIIRPYLGGQELNNNVPAHPNEPVPHSRYVINFGDRSLEEAEQWPALIDIVRRLVKPERDQLKDNPDGRKRKAYWWQFGRSVRGLEAAIAPLPRCLVNSSVSKHLLFGFQPTDKVFAHTTNVFALDDWASFAILQSRVHEHWAIAMGSSLETRPRYTPSTCFETFPFPRPNARQSAALAHAGEALYSHRQAMMVQFGEGMTKIWNRVMDPHETDPGIETLRTLRDAMDRVVLEAYGWGQLQADQKDEIMARLRRLNTQRAAAEAAHAAEGQ